MFKGSGLSKNKNVAGRRKTLVGFSCLLAVILFSAALIYFSNSDSKLEAQKTVPNVNREIASEVNVENLSPASSEDQGESFYRWGAKNADAQGLSTQVIQILGEYQAEKAGNVDFGQDESGGKYFHFYTPKQNLKEIEAKIKALLGDSFYTELVTAKDKKARPGNSRVVFVLFSDSKAKSASVSPMKIEEVATTEKPIEKIPDPTRNPSSEVVINAEPKTEAVPPVAHYHAWSEYLFSLSPYYSSVHAIDKSSQAAADFYSKQNFSIDAAWVQHWTQRFDTNLSFKACHESWDQNLTTNRTFSNSTYTTTGFEIGGAYHPSESTELSSGIALQQQSYRRSQSSGTEISFETPSVVNLDIGAKKQFHLTDEYYLGILLNGFATLPKSLPNYNIQFSPGLKLGTSLRQNFNASFLEAQVFFQYIKLNTSILEETRSNLGLSITFGFGADPNQAPAPKERAP